MTRRPSVVQRVALPVLSLVLAIFAVRMTAARADSGQVDAFARVLVDTAELRSGPGVSYRVVYLAHRGETFALSGRPSVGFWLRVMLSDGRTVYALGDEVQPFAVTPETPGAPSRPGLLAPPPLEGSHAGLAIVGGVLSIPIVGFGVQHIGYLEVRPSLVVHRTISIEAFVGDATTGDGTQLLYGGGLSIFLAPGWPICPFVGLSAGGLSVFPNPDSFVLRRADSYLARAGGGILFALRNRILVRLEASNVSFFVPDSYKNAQTYAGGLGVYF